MTDEHKAKINDTAKRALEFIKAFIAKNSYPPTYKEIEEGIGERSRSLILECLDELEFSGAIERKFTRSRFSPRSIGVIEPGKQ